MLNSRSIVLVALAICCSAVRYCAAFAVPPSASFFSKQQHASSRLPQHSSLVNRGGYATRKARGVQGLSASIPSDLQGRERLEKFLADCALLGPVRFVCMTEGAILEAVGSFDNLRYSDLPKGRYATVSEGSGFECHLNCDKIKSINMVTKRSPSGTYDLYITRFLDEAGGTLLSAMLHGVDGAYEPGAADYWEKLRQTFGAEQTVA